MLVAFLPNANLLNDTNYAKDQENSHTDIITPSCHSADIINL